jgi:hypothetical protein
MSREEQGSQLQALVAREGVGYHHLLSSSTLSLSLRSWGALVREGGTLVPW